MYSVSLYCLQYLISTHTDQWKQRNTEPVKSWTCFSISEIHFHLSYIFLKEKKLTGVISEIPVSSVPPVPGRIKTPDVAVMTPDGRETLLWCCLTVSHQQLPLA